MHDDCDHSEENDEDLDRKHLGGVIVAFQTYERHGLSKVNEYLHQYLNLSDKHKQMLPNYAQRLLKIRDGVKSNAVFLSTVLKANSEAFQVDDLVRNLFLFSHLCL